MATGDPDEPLCLLFVRGFIGPEAAAGMQPRPKVPAGGAQQCPWPWRCSFNVGPLPADTAAKQCDDREGFKCCGGTCKAVQSDAAISPGSSSSSSAESDFELAVIDLSGDGDGAGRGAAERSRPRTPVPPLDLEPSSLRAARVRASTVRQLWLAATGAGEATAAEAEARGGAVLPRSAGRAVRAALAARAPRLDYPQYEALHTGVLRCLHRTGRWLSLREAAQLAQGNWTCDAAADGSMPFDRFEASLLRLAETWATSEDTWGDDADDDSPVCAALRCLSAGAGLGGSLQAAFLCCLVEAMTTTPAPWPLLLSSAEAEGPPEGADAPCLRPMFDMPLGCCRHGAAMRTLAGRQLPRPPPPLPPSPSGPSRAWNPPSIPPCRPPRPDAEAEDRFDQASGSGPLGLRRAALHNRLRELAGAAAAAAARPRARRAPAYDPRRQA